MKICGNNPFCAICIPQSIEAKDIAITLVALAAIGLLLAGSLQVGGVISIGILGNYAWILVGGSCGILAIDVLLAIVKKCRKSEFPEEIEEFEDEDVTPKSPVTSEQVSEIYQELNTAVSESNPDINSISEISNRLAVAVKFLDPTERETNKNLLNAIITLKILIKEKWADEIDQSKSEVSGKVSNKTIFSLRQALKKLQTNCLTYYFKSKLQEQKQTLIYLKHKRKLCDSHSKHNCSAEDLKFIDSEFARWSKKLKRGKLVSFPKWYHCTKTTDTVEAIAKTSIEVRSEKGYRGAFVANYPVTSYGDFGFALSSYIEETGTKNGLLPKLSSKDGAKKVCYGTPQVNVKEKSLENKQSDVIFWVGFQNNIPMKRHIKDDPIDFYNNTTIAYIFLNSARSTASNLTKLQSIAKSSKVALVTLDQVSAMKTLFDLTFPLSFPKTWEGYLESF